MSTEFWTMERIDRLFAMVLDGASFSAIGADLGCSRNACIGKYNRVRVARGIHTRKPRPSTIVRLREARRPKSPAGFAEADIGPKTPSIAPRVAAPMLKVVFTPAPPPGEGVSIVDVSGCRYAIADDPSLVGGMAFCDAATENGASYCPDHARIVYAKPAKTGAAKRFMIPISLLRMGAR